MAFNNILRSAAKTAGEVYVKPTTDEVGKMVEEGARAIAGTSFKQTDPAEEAKKKAEEEKRKRNILQFFERFKSDQQVYQQAKILKQQEEQKKQQEEVKKYQVKQLEIQKKQESIAVTQAKTRAEVKGGVGG